MSYKINSFSISEKAVGSYEKKLSICLMTNGFSFSVTTVHDELLAIGEVGCNLNAPMPVLLSDIKGAMDQCKISSIGFHDVELVVNTHQFVWIPQHLYDITQRRAYLEALCTIDASCGVYDSYNETIKSTIVFSAESSVVSTFMVALPGLAVRCQHEKFVNNDTIAASDLKSLMIVNAREGESDFCLFCNKKLQISNTYTCSNFDEVMFHSLNLSKQFHLDDAEMAVAICGNVDEGQYAMFCKFFPQVALYMGRSLTLTNPDMQHVRLYRYATVL